MSTITYNKKDIQRILKSNGWTVHRQKGSHIVYKNANGEHLTVTVNTCNKMIMQRLIKQYGLQV